MDYWSVAQTEPQRERLAKDQLENQLHYSVYLPRVRVRKNRRNYTPPLFPTYLFVRIVEDKWWSVRWAMGVIGLIMSGDHPARLKDAIIAEIKSREVNGFVKLKLAPKFRKGQQVRVLGGRFDGQFALYEGQTAKERQRVLLEILGQWAQVELGPNDRIESTQDIAAAS